MFNPFRPKTAQKSVSSEPEPASLPPVTPLPAVAVAPPVTLPPAPPVARPTVPPVAPPAPVAAPVKPAPASMPTGAAVPLSTSAATVLEQLVAKLPGLLFVGLTEADSGTLIRSRTPGDRLPADGIALYHAEIVQLKQLALKQVDSSLTPEDLREILITLSDQLHIVRLVRQGRLLLSIVLDASQASLPMARMALNTAANAIG